MTLELVDAAFRACLVHTNREVARELSLPEDRVAGAFRARSVQYLAGHAPAPSVPLLRVAPVRGMRDVVLAFDAVDAGLVDRFDGFADPRLDAFLGRVRGSLVHADWRAGLVLAGRADVDGVSIHRLSAIDHVRDRLPACAARMRVRLGSSGVAALRAVEPWLGTPDLLLGAEGDEALRRARARRDEISSFVTICRTAPGIFGGRDRAASVAATSAWVASASDRSMVFSPLLDAVSRVGPHVLGEGYGVIPALRWRSMAARGPMERAGDTAFRALVREIADIVEAPSLPPGPRPGMPGVEGWAAG